MEDGDEERPHAGGHKHVAELRDRRIRQHLLDVVLGDGNGGRHDRRERCHDGDDQHDVGRAKHHRREAGEQVESARDHCRRVDERRDRRRAGHGIRQPDKKRNLGALTGGPDKEQQNGPVQVGLRHGGRRIGEERAEIQSTQFAKQQEHRNQKSGVANAVDDKGLVGRNTVPDVLVPEPDQQVGAETHAFPTQEYDDEVVAHHQVEHREHEQVQVREELPVAPIALHVADRVDVDKRADARHDQHHDQRKLIDAVGKVDTQSAGGHPRIERGHLGLAVERREEVYRQDEGYGNQRGGYGANESLLLPQRRHEKPDDAAKNGTG